MIPFSPPRIDDKIIEEVVDTLRSGWISTGPKTKRFEKELSAYYNAPATLCLNSATAGLEIMLRWFGVTEGDEVILPAYTYSSTANVVLHCGATPVFVDVNDDFNINPTLVEGAITPRTKVIMPVDFSGFPANYNAINALVRRADIVAQFNSATPEQQSLGRIMVLADAAHSIGAVYHGKKTGVLADATVFSFHAVKNLTTAEGGAVAFNLPAPFDNEQIYRDLCITTLHGQTKDALAKMQPGNWKYDIIEAGYKFNMTDIAASIGLIELARYESDMLPKRKQIVEYYLTRFKDIAWAQLPSVQTAEATTSYHLFPLRIKGITEEQRDAIMQAIFAKGVSVNVHFIPVPGLSYYKKLGYNVLDYPIAYDSYIREITLPVFYNLTEEQMKTVADVVIEVVNGFIA
jgi:dTDP-4-amino-4,6-dideoxygalactose transaminase